MLWVFCALPAPPTMATSVRDINTNDQRGWLFNAGLTLTWVKVELTVLVSVFPFNC